MSSSSSISASSSVAVSVEHGVGFFVRFRAHDVGDAEPLLIAVRGFDHPQHDDARAGTQRATAGKVHGAIAFRRVVDHHQEFRRMACLVAAAPLAHRAHSRR
jgi:hypothetical protein